MNLLNEQVSHNKHFWFNNDFDPQIKKWIIENSNLVNYTCSCQDDSFNWAKILRKQFPEETVALVGGFYYPHGNYENGEGHTWIEINGDIFDPVGDIFDDYPNLDSSYYEETENDFGETEADYD